MKRIKMKQNGVFVGYILETLEINGEMEHIVQYKGQRFFIKADLVYIHQYSNTILI